jgi:hypothetical protein
MKARFAFAATLVGASLVLAAVSSAQQPAAPPMQSILAGKKFIPPLKGQADIEFVRSPTKREGATLVTRVQVKNTSPAPIARLKITETWYDKTGGMIPGGEGVINGLLQPGEVQTIEIRTPTNANMNSSMYTFNHANGTVKTHQVKSLDAKEPAAKNASATKPVAAAKSSKKK